MNPSQDLRNRALPTPHIPRAKLQNFAELRGCLAQKSTRRVFAHSVSFSAGFAALNASFGPAFDLVRDRLL